MDFEQLLELGQQNPKELIKYLKKQNKKEGLVFKNLNPKVKQYIQEVKKCTNYT